MKDFQLDEGHGIQKLLLQLVTFAGTSYGMVNAPFV
jgi:hypothetical protein